MSQSSKIKSKKRLRSIGSRKGKSAEKKEQGQVKSKDADTDTSLVQHPPKYQVSVDQEMLQHRRIQPTLRPIRQLIKKIRMYSWRQDPPLKVSYCTTCFNRFWQLKKVLPVNLEQTDGDPNVEFVIIDFGGEDSQKIERFLTENFRKELVEGRIRYFQRKPDIPPFEWNVAIAKNVAHRFATGDIVVNLDGDNYLQKDDSRVIRYYFNQASNGMILQQSWSNLALVNMFTSLKLRPDHYDIPSWHLLNNNRGTYGRISLLRRDFQRLGGYNEQMVNMGNQDTDILFRAIHMDFTYKVTLPRPYGSYSSILNKTDIKRGQLKHNRKLTQQAYLQQRFVVNRTGFRENLEDYRPIVVSDESRPIVVSDESRPIVVSDESRPIVVSAESTLEENTIGNVTVVDAKLIEQKPQEIGEKSECTDELCEFCHQPMSNHW